MLDFISYTYIHNIYMYVYIYIYKQLKQRSIGLLNNLLLINDMYPVVRQILKQKTGNMITSDILATFNTKCSHDYNNPSHSLFYPVHTCTARG